MRGSVMSDDREDKKNINDIFANNNGVIKSWQGLALVLGGFFGFMVLLVVLSRIPSLQWLLITLVGALFLAGGLLFLKLAKTSYNLPLFAVMIGLVTIYMGLGGKFFPDLMDTIGDKGPASIVITISLIMFLYPIIAMVYAKSRCKVTVEATVVRVDSHTAINSKGHHVRTFRPVYGFTYEGREYTVMKKVYTSGGHLWEGEIRNLVINENNPEIFYDLDKFKSNLKSFTSYIPSLFLLALGIYLLIG